MVQRMIMAANRAVNQGQVTLKEVLVIRIGPPALSKVSHRPNPAAVPLVPPGTASLAQHPRIVHESATVALRGGNQPARAQCLGSGRGPLYLPTRGLQTDPPSGGGIGRGDF